MSFITTRLGTKPWAEAEAKARLILESPETSEAGRKECEAMLASHPGNPANTNIAALQAKYPTANAALKAAASGEVSQDNASKLLGALTTKAAAKAEGEEKADWQCVVQLASNTLADLKAKFAAGEIDVDAFASQVQATKTGLSLAFNPAKGTVALRGVRRFTIAYYREEWLAILGVGPAILDYLAAHAEELEEAEALGKAK